MGKFTLALYHNQEWMSNVRGGFAMIDMVSMSDKIMPVDDLIVIEQLPIIRERLQLLGADIEQKLKYVDSLECTVETVKAIKEIRANFNKDSSYWESKRKGIKAAVSAPYDQFELAYKEFVGNPYKHADMVLKTKIDDVEGAIKRRKREELREWFEEYRLSRGVDFANMDTWNPNITLTATLTALKREGKAYIDRICDDLGLIETQDHKTEIMVEYRRSLNVSQAIAAVAQRHKAIEEQAARQAEQESRKIAEQEAVKRIEAAIPPPLAPPVTIVQDDDPIRTLEFKVTAPLSMLRMLKKFLEDGGYKCE